MVSQAGGETRPPPGGGAVAGSLAPEGGGRPPTRPVVPTWLSAGFQDLVKAVTPPRYKLVCSVSIGSKGQDDTVVSSQSLWDPCADRFATSHCVNRTLPCVALVHAIYLE